MIDNKAEAAYRRGDLFEKRRKLTEAWAVYCAAPKTAKIVALKAIGYRIARIGRLPL